MGIEAANAALKDSDMDKDAADAITIIEKQLADANQRLAIAEEKLVKVFALLDEYHSTLTGLISWTDQAPRASS
jgi:hypothetical protein